MRPRLIYPLIMAFVIAVLIILPLFVDLGSSNMNLFILLFIFIILSTSWNLLGGYTGKINLGFAAFFGCGVLVTHLLWKSGTPIYLAVIISALSAVFLAAIIGLPTLHLKGAYFAIGTIAFAEALRIVIGNIFPSSLSLPGDAATNFNVLPRYYLGLGIAVATVTFTYFLTRSRFGLAMVCVRDDEDAAQAIGINTFKTKFISFLISAFIAGLAGGAFSYNRFYFHHISTVFEPVWTFEPLMAVVIGGAGTLFGPIIGSVFLVVLSEIFAQLLGDVHLIIFGLLLIPVVLYSPSGLMGLVRILRKLVTGRSG